MIRMVVDRAIREAQADPRPSFLCCRTVIGYGAPAEAGALQIRTALRLAPRKWRGRERPWTGPILLSRFRRSSRSLERPGERRGTGVPMAGTNGRLCRPLPRKMRPNWPGAWKATCLRRSRSRLTPYQESAGRACKSGDPQALREHLGCDCRQPAGTDWRLGGSDRGPTTLNPRAAVRSARTSPAPTSTTGSGSSAWGP